MRKAIATIEAEIGTMTIYYNGEGEALTVEAEDVVGTLDYIAKSEEDAIDAAWAMYSIPGWDLQLI